MSAAFEVQDDREQGRIFIHSLLDDYGLSTSEFRVYAHLVRRADKVHKEAFPSVATIAIKCRLHEDTVRTSLKCLLRHGLITRKIRPGHSCIVKIMPPSHWKETYTEHPPETDTPPSDSGITPPKRGEDNPPETRGDEGKPMKDIQEGNPITGAKRKKAAAMENTISIIQEHSEDPEVQDLWRVWVEHRIEIKHPITPQSAKMQINQLSAWGKDKWMAAVKKSVLNGWRGLFDEEPKKTLSANGRPAWEERRSLEAELRDKQPQLDEMNDLLKQDYNRNPESIDIRKTLRERVKTIKARIAELNA